MNDVAGHSFPLATVDIMCGAGGLSLGFADARAPDGTPAFSIEYGVDIDDACMATFRHNLFRCASPGEQTQRGPARSVVGLTVSEILEATGGNAVDVAIGGPNCQAVSTAGVRNPDDERNEMFHEFRRLVGELRPRWFVMENVPGIVHANALPLLQEVLQALKALDGYEVAADVLLAADQGVAQYRYRLFVIGTRSGLPIRFPAPAYFRDGEPKHPTVRDALGVGGDGQAKTEVGEVDLVNVQRIKHVPAGGDWRDIPVRLLPERNFWVRSSDQRGAYGRLSWDEPAYTITGLFGNVTAGRFTHPEEDRPISAAEAVRLQGFPSHFELKGATPSWHRQLGNAVPPPLARSVAEAIVRSELGLSDAHGDVEGRLNLESVTAAVEGRRRLPVLTPRLSRRTTSRRPGIATITRPAIVRTVDGKSEEARLRADAATTGYRWTAKRARAILGAREGKSVATLSAELKASERSIARWLADYERDGPEGWRAYHTPIDALARTPEEIGKLRTAVEDVRRPSMDATRVNGRLKALIARYGDLSVNSLLGLLREAGVEPGTVYVGDLLAACGVLLTDDQWDVSRAQGE